MAKDKIIKCFVPALALEHHSNDESFNKIDKIRAALYRLDQTGDFFVLEEPKEHPDVFFEKVEFKPRELGYFVIAKISY